MGRADQAPARAVLCPRAGVEKDVPSSSDGTTGEAQDTGAAGGDPCICLEEKSEAKRAACENDELKDYPGDTHQQRLIAWANSTEGRKLSMRRVDLRFEVRPALEEGASGR